MRGKKLNLQALFSWAIASLFLAIALCPFAIWASRYFGGNLVQASNPVEVYTSLDFVAWLSCLHSSLTVRDGQIALLVLFLAILLIPFALDNGAVFYENDLEVRDGALADQRVFEKKGDVLKRNHAWNGKSKPAVYGLAMGGYPGAMVILPATHAAIVAPSGSGKTRGSVYETIDNLSYCAENSLIICDPSGEIYSMMSSGLRARGYKKVLRLDLNNGKMGEKYSPLKMITECQRHGDEDSAEARAIEVGEILSPETGGDNDFFNRAAAGLISAICFLVATLPDVPDDKRTLYSVVQTILKGTDGDTEKLKGFIRKYGTEGPAYVMASAFMASTDKTEANIVSSVNNVLQMAVTSSMRFITSGDDIDVAEILKEPTVVFLRVLPRGNQANKLASLFLAQHLAETLRQGDRGCLVPSYVIGDEFHAIPRFDLVTAVEQGRKFGLHYYMWVQSLAGFDAFASRAENGKEAILANCEVKALYKAGSASDAATFECLGGSKSVKTRSVSSSTTAQGVTDSEGYSEREIANWARGDLLQRDPYRDGVLVFANIAGEGEHNGKFVIPVPDVTKTPTASNFSTFGTRDHEREVISQVEARLNERASRLFIPVAWTPAYDEMVVEDSRNEQEHDADTVFFGL